MAKKNRTALFIYSAALILISIAITLAAIRFLAPGDSAAKSEEFKDLTELTANEAAASPVKDDDTVIEIFAYSCHYCALNENNIDELAKRMPAGKKLVQLHLSAPGAAFSRTDSLFATLTVMGIEKQYREKIYRAINDDLIDLGNPAVRDMWLRQNNIDLALFTKVAASEQVKTLLDYMAKISIFYKVRATPTFIVNKKWIALQDRKYPAFSNHILSLVENDRPLEQ